MALKGHSMEALSKSKTDYETCERGRAGQALQAASTQ